MRSPCCTYTRQLARQLCSGSACTVSSVHGLQLQLLASSCCTRQVWMLHHSAGLLLLTQLRCPAGVLCAVPMATVSARVLAQQLLPPPVLGVGWVNFSGILSWALLVVVFITSLPSQRRRHYRLFITAHLLLFPMVRTPGAGALYCEASIGCVKSSVRCLCCCCRCGTPALTQCIFCALRCPGAAYWRHARHAGVPGIRLVI